jgi:hypothetical protein
MRIKLFCSDEVLLRFLGLAVPESLDPLIQRLPRSPLRIRLSVWCRACSFALLATGDVRRNTATKRERDKRATAPVR